MSLYQKYRPIDFSEMRGNQKEIESLQNLLNKESKPHVYLLTGPTGCGKTTAARIMANELKAGKLSTVEINSSNNRGIDTARQIIEQMKSYPIDGPIWVFIIDEAHQATKDWQNAMLKSLEDTPKHVYFFLCTTNPEKLITAFKNRCFIFSFSYLEQKEIFNLLRRVHKKEKGDLEKEVLEEISYNCDGSPRKALVMLEKVFGMDSNKAKRLILKGIVEEDEKEIIDLCRILLNGNWNGVSEILKKLKSKNVEQIRLCVLGYMQSVILKKRNDKAAIVMEYFIHPFYDSGFPGLSLACYLSFFGGKE